MVPVPVPDHGTWKSSKPSSLFPLQAEGITEVVMFISNLCLGTSL